MSADERILELSKRLARELSQTKGQLSLDREKLGKDLEAERQGLTEELEQRQGLARAEREALAHERTRVSVLTTDPDDDVLSLNVGGQIFSTKRSTLCVFEGTYLANQFSGRWESGIETDGQGNYFLDFDPACFRLVLNFMRSKRFESSNAPCPPPVVPKEREEHFQNLVEYLGLTDALREAAEAVKAAPKRKKPTKPAAPAAPLGSTLFQSASALLDMFRRGGAPAPPGEEATAGATVPPALAAGTSGEPQDAAVIAPAVREAADQFPGGAFGTVSAPVQEPASRVAATQALGSQAATHSEPKKRGWSRKTSHKSAIVDEDDPCLVSIGNTRALASAASLRATRGFKVGRHQWKVTVHTCSDWSYVGFVGEEWNALACPIGRAAHSWGVASNGALYAGQEEVLAEGGRPARLQEFSAGTVMIFCVDMDERWASVTIDGREYSDIFSNLPAPVFPAVSNCRSPAKYSIEFIQAAEPHG